MENNMILEGYTRNSVNPIPLEGMIKITEQMKYSVCKIYKIGANGTGFLCNMPYNSVKKPFLITNNHVLNEKDIEINKKIKISFNNDKIYKYLLIDKTRITLTNKDLDFTIIEIKNKDNINLNNILELDENINIGEEYINEKYTNESIYSLHYPKGGNIVASFGLIKGINSNKIKHSCCTEDGSSGAPILLLKDFKVFGIHYGFKKNLILNEGTLIKSVKLELNPNKEKEKEKKEEKEEKEEKERMKQEREEKGFCLSNNTYGSTIEFYSYTCTNDYNLSSYIYEKSESTKIKVEIENNGSMTWPENKAELKFESDSQIKGDNVILNPQKPNEINSYDIQFNNLSQYKEGRYESYIKFYINKKNYGKKMVLNISIKKKVISEIEKNSDKIDQFRRSYDIKDKENFSDQKLYNALKYNNFNMDLAFGSLFE